MDEDVLRRFFFHVSMSANSLDILRERDAEHLGEGRVGTAGVQLLMRGRDGVSRRRLVEESDSA